MAITARDLDRYQLPARVRTKTAEQDGLACRIALADRIAGLPDIHTTEHSGDGLPGRVDVFLQLPSPSIRRQHAAALLCSIDRDGLAVHGLGEWDRHQVLSRGWGHLRGGYVELFWPRDDEELEVCWGVLQRAFQLLSRVSERLPLARTVASWDDLPRFSRTTLQ